MIHFIVCSGIRSTVSPKDVCSFRGDYFNQKSLSVLEFIWLNIIIFFSILIKKLGQMYCSLITVKLLSFQCVGKPIMPCKRQSVDLDVSVPSC